MAINFRGYLYDDSGNAIQGATVQLLEQDGDEEASTTTDSNGLWYFSESDEDSYDVKITRGSSIRYIQWDDQISLKEIDVRNSTGNTTPAATFTNITNHADNDVAYFRSLRGTGADNDEMFIRYYMDDASSNTTEVARMTVKLISASAASEDSEIRWGVAVGGSIVDVLTISNTDAGATDLTFDVAGDVNLDADGGDIFFKDGGTTFGSATNNSGNLIIKSGTTTALTFSGANVTAAGTYTGGGLMTTGGNIVIPDAGNIGSASDTDAVAISSAGVVSLSATTEASATGTAALTLAGGLGVAKDIWVGDDITLDSDSAVINFGDDQDISLTHAADTSLTVGGAGGTTGMIINNTATDGDPFLAFSLSGTQTFTMGVDDGDSDKFKIGTTAIGTSTAFSMDSSGNVAITGDLTVTGDDLYMGTNTSGYILVADGTNYNPVAVSGDVTMSNAGAITIAANAVEGSMLNNNVISGLTALTSGLASTDELMVSDAGTLKRMDVSLVTALSTGDATALAIALG